MAIQGSQDINNITIKAPQVIRKEREGEFDAFGDVSNTEVLGDMPSPPVGNVYRCANVAALNNLLVENGDFVELMGYYSISDGGGGSLYYDSLSELEVDNGHVFDGPNSNGRFIRIIPDNTLYAKWWGVKLDTTTDNTNSLVAIGQYMSSNQDVHWKLIFKTETGALSYSNNRWLFGVQKVTIIAEDVWFRCTSSSAVDADKRPFNNGYIFSNYGNNPGTPTTFFTGDTINTCNFGEISVVLSDGDINSYSVGDRVLIHAFNQQSGGRPPNLRYFEWNEISSINSNTITLKKRLLNSYSSENSDYDEGSGLIYGKARILNLERDEYIYPKYIEIIGAILDKGPNDSVGGVIFCVEHLVMRRVKSNAIVWPSINKIAQYYDCDFFQSEPDKIVDRCEFINCRFYYASSSIGTIIAATGVNNLTIDSCDINGFIKASPRNLRVTNSSLYHNGGQYGTITSYNAYTVSNFIVENNTIYHSGNLLHIINNENDDHTISVISTGNNNSILTSGLSSIAMIDKGTLLYKSDMSIYGRVTGITSSGNSNYFLYGTWRDIPSGNIIVQKIQNIRENGNKIIGGQVRMIRNPWATQLASDNSLYYYNWENRGASADLSTTLNINAYVNKLGVRILKPYTSSGTNPQLRIELKKGSSTIPIILSLTGIGHYETTPNSTYYTGTAPSTLSTLYTGITTSMIVRYFINSVSIPLSGTKQDLPHVNIYWEGNSIE